MFWKAISDCCALRRCRCLTPSPSPSLPLPPSAQLSQVDRVRIYGPSPSSPYGRAALATFNVEGIHPTDISTILDQAGVAVRSGHLCTQPVHRVLGVSATVRASPYFYNTHADVDAFVDALRDSIAFFAEMGA